MTAPHTIDHFLDAPVGKTLEPRRPADDPRREVLGGAALAAVLVLGCGGWAMATRLDSAVTGPGVVRVAEARRQIQAPAAGIVAAVRVGNGQAVRAGQVLVEFTATEASAQEQSVSARVFGLQAEIARIEAELAGRSQVAVPASFAGLADQDRAIATAALASEQAQLSAQRTLERSEVAVLRDRARQVRQQIVGQGERLASARRQGSLNQEELVSYQELFALGLSTKPRVLALQRQAASIDGEAGATVAEMARLRTQVGEAQLQVTQMRSERATHNADRLRAARTELAALFPQWTAARAQLGRTTMRAPFDGVVTAAQMPVPGMVAQPGTRLMEVVPNTGAMSVEMRVPLAEASELRHGQNAQVRLAGAGGRLLPTLAGTVERVSADSVEDERTGQGFYVASIRITQAEVARVARLGGLAGGVRPGTPVDVVVPTHARSALDYLIGPLVSRAESTFAQR